MQGKSIAKCSQGNILQYFRPSLSYHLSLRPLFVYFEWPLKTGFAVTETPILAASICMHMRICVHVGTPLLMVFLEEFYDKVISKNQQTSKSMQSGRVSSYVQMHG